MIYLKSFNKASDFDLILTTFEKEPMARPPTGIPRSKLQFATKDQKGAKVSVFTLSEVSSFI